MVENVVPFFYPNDPSTVARAPPPPPDLHVVGGGFAATCTNEEASKLVEGSTEMVDQIGS
jgi:hypothetical protein